MKTTRMDGNDIEWLNDSQVEWKAEVDRESLMDDIRDIQRSFGEGWETEKIESVLEQSIRAFDSISGRIAKHRADPNPSKTEEELDRVRRLTMAHRFYSASVKTCKKILTKRRHEALEREQQRVSEERKAARARDRKDIVDEARLKAINDIVSLIRSDRVTHPDGKIDMDSEELVEIIQSLSHPECS